MPWASAPNRRHLGAVVHSDATAALGIAYRTWRQNPSCQGAVFVDSGRGGEQGTRDWESRDFGEPQTCTEAEFVFQAWEEQRGQSGWCPRRIVGSWSQVESFHQARRNCQDAGGNVGTIQFADLRANAQSVGRCQNGASHMCDTMRFLREPGRVCPAPQARTRKVAVEPNRASLREYWQMWQ